MALPRIMLMQALPIAAGGLATCYMGDEIGLLNDHSCRGDPTLAHEGRWVHRPATDWASLTLERPIRARNDWQHLHAAHLASGGAGPSPFIDTGSNPVRGLACGRDTVFLNFSGQSVPLGDDMTAGRIDRLGARVGTDNRRSPAPWPVLWLGERA